jgi:nicotinamide-nucleotide adenylyltransferase
MDRALYIGKFQPFHNGHKEVVENLVEKHNEVIVVIGGAEKTYDTTYLFTAGERIQMVKSSIDAESVYIIPVRDINNNAIWTDHINQYTPEYNCVYSNNPLVRRLYKETDDDLKNIDMVKRDELSSTNIRNKMIEDDELWKNLVPNEVVNLIQKYDGVSRIRELNNNDIDYN